MTPPRPLLRTALGLVLLASTTAPAHALALALVQSYPPAQQIAPPPVQWDARRLDQLDRNVRRLERALFQRNAAGDPLLVEPDPEVVALQGQVAQMNQRLSDLEASLRRVTGDLERATFTAEESGRANETLAARITELEGRLKAMDDAAKAEAELNGPIVANSPTGDAGGDLAAAQRLASTDVARGDRAYQTVIATWPNTPQSREAGYRLGDLRAANEDLPGAVQAWAAALNGWPTTPWAAEATLKLASALEATDRDNQSCAALAEFTRRYAGTASAALKTRATQIRGRADCS